MKKKLILGFTIILLILTIVFVIFYNEKPTVTLKKDLTVEINTNKKILSYVDKVKNGKIITKNSKLKTDKLGKQKIKIKLKNNLGKVSNYTYEIKIVDTKAPEITFNKEINITAGDNVDLLENVTVTDNSKEDLKAKVEGEYDTNKAGTYNLTYVAIDSSNNKKTESFTLNVAEKQVKTETTKATKSENKVYSIKINRKQNIVMVYLGNSLTKVFNASTGTATPVGTFKTSDKYVWRALYGNVYGQYATRITGSILFHSVPYLKQSKDSLEYLEYNKLGTKASLGCIRLTVADAKWIYDNCPKGTTVTIYDSDTLEVSRPKTQIIDENSPNKNWDPTDPDPNNPWR